MSRWQRPSRGFAAFVLLPATAALLAAAQRCGDSAAPSQDDPVSFMQSRLAVASRMGGPTRAADQVAQEPAVSARLVVEAAPAPAMSTSLAVETTAAHGPLAILSQIALRPWGFDTGADWAALLPPASHRLGERGLGCRGLVSAWALAVAFFVGGQLLALRRHPSGPPGVKASPEDADPSWQGLAGSCHEQETWFGGWLALAWANPLFTPGSLELGAVHPSDEASGRCEAFQACWAREVKSSGMAGASLCRALCAFLGWRTIFSTLLLAAFSFVVNAVVMALSVVILLDFLHWQSAQQQQQQSSQTAPDPFYACVLVLVVCFVIPMAGIAIDVSLKVKDGRSSLRLTAALLGAIHRKAQRLLPAEDEDGAASSAVSCKLSELVAIDVAEVSRDIVRIAVQCFLAPICLIVLLAMLYMQVGTAASLAALGFLPLLPVLSYHLRGIVAARVEYQVAADQRVGLINNMLAGIHTVKCHSNEEPLIARAEKARKEELKGIWTIQKLSQQIVTLGVAWPKLVLFAVILAYSWLHPAPNRQSVFACMVILSCFNRCVSSLVLGLTKVTSSRPALLRLEAFLKLPEVPSAPEVIRPLEAGLGVRICGSFARHKGGEAVLRDLDISMPHGARVAIVGAAGSGKTALLHALLGELHPLDNAEVAGPGSAAYCAQTPWIFEGTLRENVLCGEPWRMTRYAAAIQASGLMQDLQLMPSGDSVALGGHGDSAISDSQSTRVAIARAAYSAEELVLLDEPCPMSGTEALVAVYENLLGTDALTKGRTWFVAMQPCATGLKMFDHILVLSGGRVVKQGTPNEVMASNVLQRLSSGVARPATWRGSGPFGIAAADLGLGGICSPAAKLLGQKMPPRWPTSARVAPDVGGIAETANRDADVVGSNQDVLSRFLDLIGRGRLCIFSMLALAAQAAVLLTDASLAQWSDEGPWPSAGKSWLWAYTLIWGLAVFLGVAGSAVGASCSCRFSEMMHHQLLRSVIGAPIVGFFSRQPLACLMKHFTTDVNQVDLTLWLKIANFTTLLCGLLCILLYMHAILPLYFTLAVAPCYVAMFAFACAFGRTLPCLRQQNAWQKAQLQDRLVEVLEGGASARAHYGAGGPERQRGERQARMMNSYVQSAFMAYSVGVQWLLLRLAICFSVFYTLVALTGMTSPALIGKGCFSLAIVLCVLTLQSAAESIEPYLCAQEELATVRRLRSLLEAPSEEAQEVLHHEPRFMSFRIELDGTKASQLSYVIRDGVLQIIATDGKVLFRAATDAKDLVPDYAVLRSLTSGVQVMSGLEQEMRVISVNGVCGDVENMARELCGNSMSPVQLLLRGAWLQAGALLDIRALHISYGGSTEVLRDLTLKVEAGKKVGIVGAAGSGKTTLLYALFRVLEPCSGQVLLGGVNASNIGLKRLRSALGLVPQEPLLFEGSLRDNIDPHGEHTDGQILDALRRMQLEWLAEEGSLRRSVPSRSLAACERALLAGARAALEQRSLVLLDAAAPAVQDAVCAALVRSTVISVARRPEELLGCDQVLVLERGSLSEYGTDSAGRPPLESQPDVKL